ncbi:beta-galactosidase [Tessaracoccus defluvii]
MTGDNPQMTRISYGGDYNPEQWPEQVRADDVAAMVRAGVTLVTVGVFSWGTLQPDPDTWDSAWLHRVVDDLWAAGIAVDLATPTASPPPWLGTLHPETLAVTEDGVRLGHGSRNHFCPSSPVYRAACLDVARRLGEEFGDHPGVTLWHVGNEYGQRCLCDLCAEGFRAWLRSRYGSLEVLNEAWGTAFWSQHYSSWAQVGVPRRVPYLLNPAQWLDHRRFVSDLLLDCYRDQRDVLRPLVGGRPITTNFMGFFELADYRSWAAEVDVVTDDHYGDPADQEQPSRTALVHELMRSLGNGRWLMMEQAMGAVNWRRHNVPKTSSQRRRDVLRAVAYGADGVLSFQWRQSRSGSERFHSAMLPNAGEDSRLHRDVVALGAELARLDGVAGAPVGGRVAMLFDWDSWWAAREPSVPSRDRDPLETLHAWYRPLWERGIRVDLVASTSDLGGYDLVLAPSQHLLRPEALAGLRTHLARGGQLVMGPFSAVVDGNTALLPGPFPAGLTDLLGARGEQWWPLAAPIGVASADLGDFEVTGWAEQLTLTGGRPGASFLHPDLGPAIVTSATCGFTYLACDLPPARLADLLDGALAAVGILPDLGVLADVGGAEIAVRGGVTFALNNTPAPLTLTLRGPATDVLTGAGFDRVAPLPPGGVVALREVHP